MVWLKPKSNIIYASVSIVVIVLLFASALVFQNVSQSHSGTSMSTTSTTSTVFSCSSAVAEPRIVLSLNRLYGPVYCAVFNGTAYYADYISLNITFQSDGYGRFANGSILFRGVIFALLAWDNGQAAKANMTFADGSSETVEALYGSNPYAAALKHLDPAAGVLLTGPSTCPPAVGNPPNNCPSSLDYLLVSIQT